MTDKNRSVLSRPRRLRRSAALRRLVRETTLAPSNLIMPSFVTHGRGIRTPVPSMPGVHQLSIDQLLTEADVVQRAGILSVLLFGIPKTKDQRGSEAYARQGIIQQAAR